MTEDAYVAGKIERRLAEDERAHELGVRAEVREDTIVLSGEVAGEDRRRLVAEIAAEVAVETAGTTAGAEGDEPTRLAVRNEVSETDVRPPQAPGKSPREGGA